MHHDVHPFLSYVLLLDFSSIIPSGSGKWFIMCVHLPFFITLHSPRIDVLMISIIWSCSFWKDGSKNGLMTARRRRGLQEKGCRRRRWLREWGGEEVRWKILLDTRVVLPLIPFIEFVLRFKSNRSQESSGTDLLLPWFTGWRWIRRERAKRRKNEWMSHGESSVIHSPHPDHELVIKNRSHR